jgi:short-subunit dehydrogenase
VKPLQGRVVVITGASAGIGAATARAAAVAGASVVVAARRLDRLRSLVADIESAGGHARAVEADVADADALTRLMDTAVATFGRIDVCVCNAGIGYHGPFDSTPTAVTRRLVDVNVMGTFHTARAAIAVMKRQASGHLIVVSSIVGRRGIEGSAVYAATKAAQIAFVESLRAEYAGTLIRASVVLPVSTATEFHEAIARNFGHMVRGLGPKQSAEHVARAIVGCMVRPRPEVYPYPLARGLSIVNAVAPGLTDRVVRRFRRERVVSTS